jgi:hypothetical protein
MSYRLLSLLKLFFVHHVGSLVGGGRSLDNARSALALAIQRLQAAKVCTIIIDMYLHDIFHSLRRSIGVRVS